MQDKLLILTENGDVRVTPAGMYVTKLSEVADNQDYLKVLYFLYSPLSPFETQFEKKKIARLDESKRVSKPVRDIVKSKEFQSVVAVYKDLVSPAYDRWLKAAMTKMEEMIDLWAKTPTNHKNFDKLSRSLEGTGGILDMYNKFKKLLQEDTMAMVKFRGGEDALLFELPDEENKR